MEYEDKPKKHKPERDGQPYAWYQVWQMVLARPGVATFEEILRDPTVSRRRAYNWTVAVTWFVMLAVYLFTMLQFPRYTNEFISQLPSYLVTTALYSLIALAGFIIGTMIIHIGARILGGQGAYVDLAYTLAAINAPLTAINGILVFFGASVALILLMIFLAVYQFVLTVIAIKAVNDFGWFKAFLSPLVVMFFLIGGILLLVVLR
jgi:hypothetical protein